MASDRSPRPLSRRRRHSGPTPTRPDSAPRTRQRTSPGGSGISSTVWTQAPGWSAGPDPTPVERVLRAFPDLASGAVVHAGLDLPERVDPAGPVTPDSDRRAATPGRSSAPELASAPPPGPSPTRGGADGPESAFGHGADPAQDREAVPFWIDMINARAAGRPSGTPPEGSDRHAHPARARWGQPDDPVSPESGYKHAVAADQHRHPTRLLVVDLDGEPADNQFGPAAAALLAEGGFLAVITHSHHQGGQLIDTTGSVVASAQNADLLYLQHIALIITPLRPDTATPTPAPGAYEAGGDTAGRRGVIDVLLFARPGPDRPAGSEPVAPTPTDDTGAGGHA